jgi:hypothetical protein
MILLKDKSIVSYDDKNIECIFYHYIAIVIMKIT